MLFNTPASTKSNLAAQASADMESAAAGANMAANRMTDTMATAARQFGAKGKEWLARQDQWVEPARDCVRRHPLASIGIAVGVGLLLSRLTAGRQGQSSWSEEQ